VFAPVDLYLSNGIKLAVWTVLSPGLQLIKGGFVESELKQHSYFIDFYEKGEFLETTSSFMIFPFY
jgi:hypothetical protein